MFVDPVNTKFSSAIVSFADDEGVSSDKNDAKERRKERKQQATVAKNLKVGAFVGLFFELLLICSIVKNMTGPTQHSQVDHMTFRRRAPDAVVAPDIHCSHIDLNFGSKFLLTDAELHLSRGRCEDCFIVVCLFVCLFIVVEFFIVVGDVLTCCFLQSLWFGWTKWCW
jgi:hypothetical protein